MAQSTAINWTDVTSSNVEAVAHNSDRKILAVRFGGGALYTYEGVDEDVFFAMTHADSVGKFLAQQIKGQYAYYKWSSDQELAAHLRGV